MTGSAKMTTRLSYVAMSRGIDVTTIVAPIGGRTVAS